MRETIRTALAWNPFDDLGKMANKLKGHVKRMRAKVCGHSAAARGTHGGLNTWVDQHEKEYLKSSGTFDEHAIHVLGKPIVDSVSHRVCITISSENLLLNAYRQQCLGLPSYIQVDTTHRLVVEGHNCMLVGTIDTAQHFHIIGYGICSHEDEAAHFAVLATLRDAVEAVVNERAGKRQPI